MNSHLEGIDGSTRLASRQIPLSCGLEWKLTQKQMLYEGAPLPMASCHKCRGGLSREKARRVEMRGKGHACSFLEEGTQLLHTRVPTAVLKHGDIWESTKVICDAVI